MTRKTKKLLSLISLLVLMAVAALGMISCGKEVKNAVDSAKDAISNAISDIESNVESTLDEAKEVTVTIEVTDDKGEKTSNQYTTKAATLREVLEENDMIEGEESEYGLMITAVNGLTADYATDGAYWALYKDGEYMMVGADAEILTDGAVYGLVYTKD
jgi:hypothetical protein